MNGRHQREIAPAVPGGVSSVDNTRVRVIKPLRDRSSVRLKDALKFVRHGRAKWVVEDRVIEMIPSHPKNQQAAIDIKNSYERRKCIPGRVPMGMCTTERVTNDQNVVIAPSFARQHRPLR